ncbi:hypothetical protein OBBRIDRAFT_731969 [Obba rivulosa]|uniref:Uncharacterized protein n=1 Tax=Obba rivulosa TaxID=1052685 RepID=A0A8E2DIY7_9APHY|nr:hypothetical protein OBBRIDRAFT_731969 [Obba rivulosa]
MLHNVNPDDTDIVLIQEPYIDHLKNSRAFLCWRPIYPLSHRDSNKWMCSLILVSARLETNTWTAIPIDLPDITGITLDTTTNHFHIFNVYLNIESNSLLMLLTMHCR